MKQPSTRRAILAEASAIVAGEREQTYGGPEDSFRDIAGLWNAYLQAKSRNLTRGEPRDDYRLPKIEPYDVAVMLMLMKTARLVGSSGTHRDSWVDIAGYAACGAGCGVRPAVPPEYPTHAPDPFTGGPTLPVVQASSFAGELAGTGYP